MNYLQHQHQHQHQHQYQHPGGEVGVGEATPSPAAAAKGQEEAAAAVCEECRQKPSKYKCPGCLIRTCSLPCVSSHKQRTSCSGKRHHSHVLPLSGFNDSVLLSDYNMLEEVKRFAESAQRTRAKLCPYSPYRLPVFLRGLRSAAASRRTKLLFLPSGMSKRDINQSRYDHRRRVISWTIEWRFHSTDVILYDHGIPEDASLRSVIEKHLQPGPWNHQLRQFCNVQLDHLKFFIHKHHKGPKSPFRDIDIEAPIRQELADVVILEYPVIHVFLPTHNCDFEISKDARPISQQQHRDVRDPDSSDRQHVRGVCFREQEIKEDGRLESRNDSVKRGSGSPVNNRLCRTKIASKGPSTGRGIDGDGFGFVGAVSRESEGQEEMEFEYEFDQGLIDAYSDLIAETDDFLDLDGELYTGKGKVFSSVSDEVEEGEILE